jgi:hypothetical protein
MSRQSIQLFLDADLFTIASCMYGEHKQKLGHIAGKT